VCGGRSLDRTGDVQRNCAPARWASNQPRPWSTLCGSLLLAALSRWCRGLARDNMSCSYDRHATFGSTHGQGDAKDCSPVSSGCREKRFPSGSLSRREPASARRPDADVEPIHGSALPRLSIHAQAGTVVLHGAAEAAVTTCVGLDGAPEISPVDVGPLRVSEKTNSAYAACQSRKLLERCSPLERQNRSTSGMSGSSRKCRKRSSVIREGSSLPSFGELGHLPYRVD